MRISSQQNTCPDAAPYDEPTVDTTSNSTYILIGTSDCPPYPNPNWNNPGNALDQDLDLKIPKTPKYAKVPIPVGERKAQYDNVWYLEEDPAPILGLIGVLKNGVVLYGMGSDCGVGMNSAPCPSDDPNAPSNYIDAYESEGWTFDQCGGHPSPMGGQYHIHSAESFRNDTGRTMCDLPVDTPGEHSKLLGWMLDGFAIYGQYSQGGELPTALDNCHGHTHDINGQMTYHYHMPTGFPYVIGCFKGCPEASNNPMEFNKFNGDATYGCPTGQDSDPDPTTETYAPQTLSPSSTQPAPSASSSSNSIATTTTNAGFTSATMVVSPTISNSPTDSGGTSVLYSMSILLCTLVVNILMN